MSNGGNDSQTSWVVKTILTLGVLALTALLGFDRARIVEDSRAGLELARRVDADHRVLKVETLAELKEVRTQLELVLERQKEVLAEVKRRR